MERGRGKEGGMDVSFSSAPSLHLSLSLSLFRWPVLITSCRRWNRFFVSQLGIIKRESNEFLLPPPPPPPPPPPFPPPPPPPPPLSCASGAAVFQLEKRLIATHQSPKKKKKKKKKSVGVNGKRALDAGCRGRRRGEGRGVKRGRETRTN